MEEHFNRKKEYSMSVENFKKFGQLCAEDEQVRERVKEIGIENIEGWMEYSKNELGLEFDQEDMQTLAAEMGSVDELSEDQLEQVAGGVVSSTAAAVVGAVAGGVAAAAGGAAAATAVTDNVRRGW
jgi:predicted ribosomally synthesized peptide with nif11-like leader